MKCSTGQTMSFELNLRDFDRQLWAEKLKDRRGKPPTLEVKCTKESDWEVWKGEPTSIYVQYPEDYITFSEYVIELPFQEPTITIGDGIIWDYRIDGTCSFREMRASCNCCA